MQPLRATRPILIVPLRQVVFALAFERMAFRTTPSALNCRLSDYFGVGYLRGGTTFL